jgi:hypothetical protein
MGQQVITWLLGDGRYRIHATNATGRRKRRIIEVEVIASGERFHGSARKMDRLVRALQGTSNERISSQTVDP